MREILFKAKRIDNGKWVEGNIIYSADAAEGYEAIIIPIEKSNMYADEHDKNIGFEKWYKVNHETLCQYTGLEDKNGNRIWENDIVSGKFNYEKIIGSVNYGSNAQYYIERKGLYGIYLDNSEDWLDVVGNIFDNPELLAQDGEKNA
ncbi:MAG TPA: hypothetical protein H9717_02240 [Candidatus Eisenbergiella merdipullorum]|uniref:YopX protein domain-containing protein n=1 Tax=Candidatus Eisenbergiella merdipullorum TaxID=2838553 RepID=A0A9D2KYV4_9FIRM|nr:hypothetical protein [Candidatus Eisenbergiella merdipullorum]